jgi:hypothetical protein
MCADDERKESGRGKRFEPDNNNHICFDIVDNSFFGCAEDALERWFRMNRKAQGIENVKTLLLLLAIAVIALLVVFVMMGGINKSRSSNFCMISIKLAAEKGDTDQLNCDRSYETLKRSDISDETVAKKRMLASISNCVSSVGSGTVNPFVSDPYFFRSNCLVCSDISFESDEAIRGMPYFAATNSIPGSNTETYYQKITGKAPSEKIIEQLQSLSDVGVINTSKNYSVFWKVDRDVYWNKVIENYDKGDKLDLINKDGSISDYVILGDNLDDSFIIGKDFFGFVTNVDTNNHFVSSIWVGDENFVLSKFDWKGFPPSFVDFRKQTIIIDPLSVKRPGVTFITEGDFCYYVHN